MARGRRRGQYRFCQTTNLVGASAGLGALGRPGDVVGESVLSLDGPASVVKKTRVGDETTTGELAQGLTEHYVPNVRIFGQGEIFTNVGILHERGHDEPWIIAMDCLPTRAAVLDYGSRWVIEPTFADFKGRGFELEDT